MEPHQQFLTEYSLRLLEVGASWFGAIGTLAAVAVALYLAFRSEKIKLRVDVSVAQGVRRGETDSPEFVWIMITNRSPRPARITTVSWQVGRFWSKRRFFQFLDGEGHAEKGIMNSPLPFTLNDGDQAQYFILLGGSSDWIAHFYDKALKPNPSANLKTLKLAVHTSHGACAIVRPDNSLIEELRKYAAQLEVEVR